MPRILVVDDERSTAWLIQRYLSDAGFDVVSTSNPSEATALLRDPDARFDLLLTDIVMPGVSGYDLANIAQEMKPDPPVLFVSGLTHDPAAAAGGSVAFLRKPFSRSRLLSAVSALLGGRTRVARASAAGASL